MRPYAWLSAAYVVIAAALVAWWVGLRAAADTSLGLAVVVAYAVPALAWLGIWLGSLTSSDPAERGADP